MRPRQLQAAELANVQARRVEAARQVPVVAIVAAGPALVDGAEIFYN